MYQGPWSLSFYMEQAMRDVAHGATEKAAWQRLLAFAPEGEDAEEWAWDYLEGYFEGQDE